MVVHDDQRGRPQIERAADHLARVDRGLVDAAIGQMFVAQQAVFGIEKQDPHPLDREMRHVDGQIVEQLSLIHI